MAAFLETKNLKKYFTVPGGMLHAVDNVTLSINKGETLGVVGESGCGKSTFARTLIHLLESTGGNIIFDGKDITHLNSSGLKALRHDMQIIFQDPNSSLNPRKNVEDTIREPIRLSNKRMSKKELNERIEYLMNMVGIDNRMRLAYPHELDGGRLPKGTNYVLVIYDGDKNLAGGRAEDTFIVSKYNPTININTTATNNAGGINGGITNGNELYFRIAVKPTSSITKSQQTFNFETGKVETLQVKGRHDACIALRVPPILEAMTAIVLADLKLVAKAL